MDLKTGIYICNVFPPYLTLNFQEETCRTVCEMKDLKNIFVVRDIEEKFNIKNLLDNLNEYDNIVIYSLICLGDNLGDIIKSIEKILDSDTKLISITDPINLNNFGKDTTENLLLSLAIGSAIKTNDIWKEIKKFKMK